MVQPDIKNQKILHESYAIKIMVKKAHSLRYKIYRKSKKKGKYLWISLVCFLSEIFSSKFRNFAVFLKNAGGCAADNLQQKNWNYVGATSGMQYRELKKSFWC